jgi:hypothetical protein
MSGVEGRAGSKWQRVGSAWVNRCVWGGCELNLVGAVDWAHMDRSGVVQVMDRLVYHLRDE